MTMTSGCSSVRHLAVKPAQVPKDLKGLNIENVSLSSKTFSPGKDEKVEIKYKLTKDADTTISILDQEEDLVRQLNAAGAQEGYSKAVWDGRDNNGRVVGDGVYTYVISAETDSGEKAVYDPVYTRGMNLEVRKLAFDKERMSISYVMPKAGMIRIRLGIKDGGPLLKTLVDWQPRAAGENVEAWDGKDKGGLMQFHENPDLQISVSSYSLAENAIIADGGNGRRYNYPYMNKLRRELTEENKRLLHKHALHKRAQCCEPEFSLDFIDCEKKDDLPVLKDVVLVRVALSEQDKKTLTDTRYEIAFFIDNLFLFEEEDGFSPYTYMLNTRGLASGRHFITCTVQSYDDHIGTNTKKVIIKKPEKE